jgi:hypothetical protein
MKHWSITSIKNKKPERAVGAPWFIPFEEIQVGAISREDDDFNFFAKVRG